MAGGVLKTIGILFVIIGILALIGGGAAATFGYFDEQDNQDALVVDPDRTEMNEMLLLYGGIGGGVGVVLLILGIVFNAAGGARSNAKFKKDMLEAASRPATVAAGPAVRQTEADGDGAAGSKPRRKTPRRRKAARA